MSVWGSTYQYQCPLKQEVLESLLEVAEAITERSSEEKNREQMRDPNTGRTHVFFLLILNRTSKKTKNLSSLEKDSYKDV